MDRRPIETSQDDDLDDVRLNPNTPHSAFQRRQLEQEMSRFYADTQESESSAARSTAQSAVLSSVAINAMNSLPLKNLDVLGISVAASADEPFSFY